MDIWFSHVLPAVGPFNVSELLFHLCGLNVAAEFFNVLQTWFKCYNAVTVGFILFSSDLMLMSDATVLNRP